MYWWMTSIMVKPRSNPINLDTLLIRLNERNTRKKKILASWAKKDFHFFRTSSKQLSKCLYRLERGGWATLTSPLDPPLSSIGSIKRQFNHLPPRSCFCGISQSTFSSVSYYACGSVLFTNGVVIWRGCSNAGLCEDGAEMSLEVDKCIYPSDFFHKPPPPILIPIFITSFNCYFGKL